MILTLHTLTVVVFYLTFGLLLTGVFLYFPQHLAFINTRAAYYLFGRDVGAVNGVADSFVRLKHAASLTLDSSMASLGSLTGWGGSAAGEL